MSLCYSITNLFGCMADTVFQCIELFTVTLLEYLVLGMNKYINHLRREEPSDGYDLPLTKITDEEVANPCLTLCLVTYLPAIGIMIIREVIFKIIHMML